MNRLENLNYLQMVNDILQGIMFFLIIGVVEEMKNKRDQVFESHCTYK